MKYVYIVWFGDSGVPADDPEYWLPCGCVIEAATKEAAKNWGDRLARACELATGDVMGESSIEELSASSPAVMHELPVVADGYEATAKELDW